jgi:hypothetical protein
MALLTALSTTTFLWYLVRNINQLTSLMQEYKLQFGKLV